jgi:radical SAM protein with 4Fe4S-binding SPASM domain
MNGFIRITDHCVLKQLEDGYLYDIRTDELYQLDQEAIDFLRLCDGTKRVEELKGDNQFIEYCLEEGLLELHSYPQYKPMKVIPSPKPSLRYLELQLTHRCNLRCSHCYLDHPIPLDLDLDIVVNILEEFEVMQGLRLIISGGEPLLYPYFWELNRLLPQYAFRKVLLTNATQITLEVAKRLRVDEVQISLDGLEKGHEILRGPNTYQKTISALQAIQEVGLDISIATMLHPFNLDEIPLLAQQLEAYTLKEWSIDLPIVTGRLKKNKPLILSVEQAAPYLSYRFGASYHDSEEGYCCGYHLATIMPNGQVCQCGFFADRPVGHINEGLINCWQRIKHIPLAQLQCSDCPYLLDCRGGCRYRANCWNGPDPLMCTLFGVAPS